MKSWKMVKDRFGASDGSNSIQIGSVIGNFERKINPEEIKQNITNNSSLRGLVRMEGSRLKLEDELIKVRQLIAALDTFNSCASLLLTILALRLTTIRSCSMKLSRKSSILSLAPKAS